MSGPARPRILFWYDTTARQPFETGIQRVTRRLGRALARQGDLIPIGFDARRRDLVPAAPPPAAEPPPPVQPGDWLLVTEIPLRAVAAGTDPVRLGRAYGLHTAALVHDLIPARMPDRYDPASRRLFAAYYRMFAAVDLALATTRLVADHLRVHLESEGLRVPPIAVVPLPAQFAEMARRVVPAPPRAEGAPLRILSVGTLEPRKNLPRWLRAVRALVDAGHAIEVTVAGKRSGYSDYEAEVEALLGTLPGSRLREGLDDAALAAEFAAHHASVYASLEEGFGLPVLESLWLATPCLCHRESAMAEVAPGGGTLCVDMADEAAIADAITGLVAAPDRLADLAQEAVARPLRSWPDMAGDIRAHLVGPAA